VAGLEKEAIVGTKGYVNEATLPPTSELATNMDAFFTSVARPEVQARAIALFQKGLQTRSEVELNLGEHVATYVPNV
jgi:hypothetical protein